MAVGRQGCNTDSQTFPVDCGFYSFQNGIFIVCQNSSKFNGILFHEGPPVGENK